MAKRAGGSTRVQAARPKKKAAASAPDSRGEGAAAQPAELVIITGLSGSGKGTVLKAFEDLGYFCVDNLPVDLIPTFAKLTHGAPHIRRAALVVDIREGERLKRFPVLYRDLKAAMNTQLVFLEADDEVLVRRFSETRRPHPLGTQRSVLRSVHTEREHLTPIRPLADHVINTTRFNVHELRELIGEKFGANRDESQIMIYVTSFGYRHGVPGDSDLVFDVRFLPNPNYIPEFKHLTGRHPGVARYIRSFPQTVEFIQRIGDLLTYLLPHYIREGKSYLTIAFGCTGGHHRSVMMAEEIRKRLRKAGYRVKGTHRDLAR